MSESFARRGYRRRLGVATAVASALAVVVPAIPVQAGGFGVPSLATGDVGPPPGSDITTVTTTCTTALVIVLLSPFATVPCSGDQAGRPWWQR